MRLSMTVTMTPFSKWNQEKDENLLKQRMNAVKKGLTTTHWPHEYYAHHFPDTDGKEIKQNAYVIPTLNE